MFHKFQGHWVVLNNVHLMPRWLPTLDKRLDHFKEIGSNPGFRVMLSSDPSDMIPVGILERQENKPKQPVAELHRQVDDTPPSSRGVTIYFCGY